MKKNNKRNLFWLIPSLVIAIVMLILECMPNGVEMVFSWSDETTGIMIRKSQFYTYFSDMLYDYGNFAPILIGVLTIATILLCLIDIFVDKKGLTISIAVLNVLKLILSAIELVFSRTAINWAIFAISIVFATYGITSLIIRLKQEKQSLSE